MNRGPAVAGGRGPDGGDPLGVGKRSRVGEDREDVESGARFSNKMFSLSFTMNNHGLMIDCLQSDHSGCS